MSDSARRKLFVGIDYGTTFSGIAYALPNVSDGKDVEVVSNWPGRQGTNSELLEKVPSRIAYRHESGPHEGADEPKATLWGYEVTPNSSYVTYSWTKLLLDEQKQLFHDDDLDLINSQEHGLLRLPQGKTAQDVASDYLKHLHNHCMETLERHYAEFLGITPIEFWFTMPAIWSPKAQKATQEAALKAGFGSRPLDTIHMITEPHAGVIAAMRTQVQITQEALEVGTGLLVCDCGGGTVDLTSYAIEKLEPILELHETCPGNGKKCGATFIDRNFYRLMASRFGDVFTSRSIDKTGPGSKFMDEFQRLKHNFSTSQRIAEPISLKLPGIDSRKVDPSWYNFEEDEVQVSWNDLKMCFDPVIDQIIELIEQQVEDTQLNGYPRIQACTIILLGGFGSSSYLWDKVRQWGIKQGIRTISPTKAWSAIARGAALRGLDGSKVPVTKCRYHFGYTVDAPYDEGRDKDPDKTYVNEKGVKMTRDCMEWFIKKNETITHNTKKKASYSLHYSPSKGEKIRKLEIYYCTLSKAPQTKGFLTKLLGTIEVSIDDVDLRKCEKYSYKGRDRYRIPFDAVVTLGTDEGIMQIAVQWNGKDCGSGRLKFPAGDEMNRLGYYKAG